MPAGCKGLAYTHMRIYRGRQQRRHTTSNEWANLVAQAPSSDAVAQSLVTVVQQIVVQIGENRAKVPVFDRPRWRSTIILDMAQDGKPQRGSAVSRLEKAEKQVGDTDGNYLEP